MTSTIARASDATPRPRRAGCLGPVPVGRVTWPTIRSQVREALDMDPSARQAQPDEGGLDPVDHVDRPADVDVTGSQVRDQLAERPGGQRVVGHLARAAPADEVVDRRPTLRGEELQLLAEDDVLLG